MECRLSLYLFLVLLALFSATLFAQHTTALECVDYVNPFIGNADANVKSASLAYNFNGGNTYPGAVTPWGMTAISPRNSLDSPAPGDFSASPSGYRYGEECLYGFGQIHLSGVGCNEWGNVLVMPTIGQISTDTSVNRSRYSDELAVPGYYKARLDDFDIVAEVSATTRTTIAKFTSNRAADRFNVVVDLYHAIRAAQDGHIRVNSTTEIEGWSQSGGFCGYALQRKVFFVARFSKPAKWCGTFNNGLIYEDVAEQSGPQTGSIAQFDMAAGEALHVQIGISFVSVANARQNLQVEQPHLDFENVRRNARQSWNSLLSRIMVEGGTHDQRVMFYSALYHALIHPSVCSDVNGEYVAMGSHRVKSLPADRMRQYNVYSLWDTYRNLHPLLALVYPEMQLDPDSIKGSIPNANFPCGGVGYTEGNAWQYNFFVPHDIDGLIELMGRESFLRRLEECFEKPDRFVLFNEPDMSYPYLFTYLDGQAWRTQELVRKSIAHYFSAGPGGLPGNDDCGTTSSWLIFSSIGFYPACPASTRYQIGSPLFDKVAIQLQPKHYPGSSFVVTAKNNSASNMYIRKMRLNGKKYKDNFLDHGSIVRGGRLEFEMGRSPATR